jgi:MFS transporter, SET family, sugar efflux transporter
MFSALPLIASTPALRTATLCLLCFGVSLSSTIPYQSLIGIKELGMSDGDFAAFMFAVAIVSVVVSVALGILSDLVANRKLLVLGLAGLGTVGYGIVWLFPSPLVFIATMLTALPLTRALFSVLFGGIRRDLEGHSADDITRVNSSIRATYALSWIVVPGAAAWALRDSPTLLPVFLVASAANALLFLIYALFAPPSGTAKPAAGGGFLSSLSLLASWPLLLRIFIIALGSGAHTLHSALHPLIMTDVAGGTTQHVGLYAGALAALEIPFMFMWAEVARRRSIGTALMLALLVYAAYCGLLGFATAPWHMFAIAILNGCGAAAVLSLPISYFQDLFADRPGLGTSLVPVMTFTGGLIGSAGFALGTAVSGYSGTAFVVGAMCLAGAAGLALLERRA